MKKILHIDMDGVVADFNKAINVISPSTNMKAYSREVDDICEKHPLIFHSLEPIQDAIESVNKLSEYFEIFFLSTAMWHIPESFIGKRLWLEKHFGDFAKKKLILTHRKDLVIGDYLVDDNIVNGVSEFKGVHIHFGSKQFPDWKTIYDYLTIRP